MPVQATPMDPTETRPRRYTQSSPEQAPLAIGQFVGSPPSNSISELHSQLPAIPDFPSPFNEHIPTPLANPFSPPFTFSPLPQGSFSPVFTNPPPANGNGARQATAYYEMSKQLQTVATPGGRSLSGSTHANTDVEKDPFLTLLEQLAENEHSRGGPSDLDFYLGSETQ